MGGVGLVGISIRFCAFDHILDLVWRVLDVYVDSPASAANLVSRTDFIIGTPDHLFTDSEDFFNLVNANMQKPILFYVYNALIEDVRIISITPNKEWGGSGSLGCDIGYGYLHRIPVRLPSNPTSPINRTSVPSSPITNTLVNTTTTPDNNVNIGKNSTPKNSEPAHVHTPPDSSLVDSIGNTFSEVEISDKAIRTSTPTPIDEEDSHKIL